MKEVTFKGGDVKDVSGVQLGDAYFPLDTPVVVSDREAKAAEESDLKFTVKDADGPRTDPQEPTPDPGEGFGGSQEPTTTET